MRIELPFPPRDLNPNKRHHWAHVVEAKQTFGVNCFLIAKTVSRQAGWVPTKAEIPLTITYVMPDKQRRDRDNLLAASKRGLDALARALGVDDNQFEPIVLKRAYGKKPGAMIVEVGAGA